MAELVDQIIAATPVSSQVAFALASGQGDPTEHGASIDRKGLLSAIAWTDKN